MPRYSFPSPKTRRPSTVFDSLKALLWPATDRLLFHYWDGEKRRAVDPLTAWRALWTHDADFASTVLVARNPQKSDGSPFYAIEDVYEAEDKLWNIIRDVFQVREWKESQPGLTIDETDKLLASFMAFMDEVKKKRSPSPMPSAPLESMEPPFSSVIGDFPDGAASDCSSTPSASTDAVPTGS